MDYQKLAESIKRHIENRPRDASAYTDLFSLCRQWEEENFQEAHALNKELRVMAAKQLRLASPSEAERFYEAWRKSLLFDAPHNFDAFMTYIELDRKPEKRFYAPRRHYLKPMVQGFQDILDNIHAETSGKVPDRHQFCKYALREIPRPIYADGRYR